MTFVSSGKKSGREREFCMSEETKSAWTDHTFNPWIGCSKVMRDMCRAHGIAFFYKQSAGRFTETGIELDGEIVREFPQCDVTVGV